MVLTTRNFAAPLHLNTTKNIDLQIFSNQQMNFYNQIDLTSIQVDRDPIKYNANKKKEKKPMTGLGSNTYLYLQIQIQIRRICIWSNFIPCICISIWNSKKKVHVFVFDKTYLTPALTDELIVLTLFWTPKEKHISFDISISYNDLA